MKHLLSIVIMAGCATSAPDNKSVSSPTSNPDIAQVSSPGATPCSQEIALECASGVDGCLDNRTTVHVCIAAAATAGPSCSQEVALACQPGELDACSMSPPASANHICVRR